MADDNPQVEEPEDVKQAPQPEAMNQEVQEILEVLDRIGANTPEKVEGMFHASQQAGRHANEIGELRQELENMRRQKAPTPEYSYDEQAPIDLRGEVRSVLKEFWREQTEAQQQQYRQITQERAAIQADPDYALVGEAFEKYMASPNMQMALSAGQTTPMSEYNKMVRKVLKEAALRSRSALQKMQELGTKQTAPPHVEKGSASQPKLPEDDEKAEKLRNIQKNWTGDDSDIDQVINTILPPGDPLLRTGL